VERCTFVVRLKPGAKHDGITVIPGESTIQVAVTAPPVENRANDRCIVLMAKRLGVAKSSLSIIKGGHCREKVIACEGLSIDEVRRRLAQ